MFKRDLIKGFLSALFLPMFQVKNSNNEQPIAEDLQDKYDKILFSLALRNDNNHIFGVGGNSFQFLTIMQMNHYHADVQTIGFHEDKMYINEQWLRDSNLKTVRAELDAVFETASEEFKTIAKDYEVMPFASFMYKHKDYFPTLNDGSDIIKTIVYEDLSKATKFEHLLISCYLASIIAMDLDNNDYTNVGFFFKTIDSFHHPVSLYAVRTLIGIQRIIKHNLDEDYGSVMKNWQKEVCN